MSRAPWRLVFRHLKAHPVRSGLTLAAVALAVFLLCFLRSLVTTLDRAVTQAASNRLIVQSAVSLFVDLPIDYQAKVAQVPGVGQVSKFQWFGGYFREPRNFFAQFAVDTDSFLDMYTRDMEIVEAAEGLTGPAAAAAARRSLAGDRRGAIIGQGLARDFGWKVGDLVPLQSGIFVREDGQPWEFQVVGIYRPLKSNVDDRTLFFRFDYLQETLRAGTATGPLGVGTYAVNLAPGASPSEVSAAIDQLFAAGPQATKTTTEAAFQASFVSMMGNLPMFVGSIGGAVVFAVFFSLVNTMVMAARQRLREAGVLKALGFSDPVLAGLFVGESLLLSVGGGALGVLTAALTAEPFRQALGSRFPNYVVEDSTLLLGFTAAAVIGILAAVAPAWLVSRLRPVEALRSEG